MEKWVTPPKTPMSDEEADFCWSVERSTEALVAFDKVVAKEVEAAKPEIGRMADEAESHLSRRLTADEPNRLAAFKIESDLIEHLKRVYYFAKRIAKLVIEEEMEYLENTPSNR